MRLILRYSQETLASGYVYPFLQLSIDRNTDVHENVGTIKLNKDCKCLRHLAGNAGSLHENSQSRRSSYCSHMINVIIYHHYQRKADNPMQDNPKKSWILNSTLCIQDFRYWIPLRFLVSGIHDHQRDWGFLELTSHGFQSPGFRIRWNNFADPSSSKSKKFPDSWNRIASQR